MPLNDWFRDHPYAVALIGLVLVGLGVIRAEPIAAVAGVVVVLAAITRLAM